MTLGLIWAWLQTAGSTDWATVFLALYLIATTALFGSVPWSKFSHMFFKPAAAFQKRVERGERLAEQPACARRRARKLRQRSPSTPQHYCIDLDTGLHPERQGNTMPTFVYMTSCDGCGHCVDICPSDIMHIDHDLPPRLSTSSPTMCWECYSCVKACPQNAIDCRGYADFAPLRPQRAGAAGRRRRERSRGRSSSATAAKRISSPRSAPRRGDRSSHRLNTQPPTRDALKSQELAHEPEALHIDRAAGAHARSTQARSAVMGLFSRRKTVHRGFRTSSSSAAAWAGAAPPTNPATGAAT